MLTVLKVKSRHMIEIICLVWRCHHSECLWACVCPLTPTPGRRIWPPWWCWSEWRTRAEVSCESISSHWPGPRALQTSPPLRLKLGIESELFALLYLLCSEISPDCANWWVSTPLKYSAGTYSILLLVSPPAELTDSPASSSSSDLAAPFSTPPGFSAC